MEPCAEGASAGRELPDAPRAWSGSESLAEGADIDEAGLEEAEVSSIPAVMAANGAARGELTWAGWLSVPVARSSWAVGAWGRLARACGEGARSWFKAARDARPGSRVVAAATVLGFFSLDCAGLARAASAAGAAEKGAFGCGACEAVASGACAPWEAWARVSEKFDPPVDSSDEGACPCIRLEDPEVEAALLAA